MKKQFFTFLMMIALVIVAGSAMAQSSAVSPYAGAKHNYKWGGIGTANSETFQFYITSDASGATRVADQSNYVMAANGTTGTFVQTDGSENFNGTVPGGGEVDVDITWDAGLAASTQFYLWLRIDDNKSCYNTKKVLITIQLNNLNFTIAQLTATTNWATSDALAVDDSTIPEECLDESTITSGDGNSGYNAGTTTLYYKIKRVGGSVNTWDLDLALTANPAYTYSITVNDGSSNLINNAPGTANVAGTTHNLSNVGASVNALLVTVVLVNDPSVTSNSTLAATISNGHEDGTNVNELA